MLVKNRNRKNIKWIAQIVLFLALSACNTTENIPDGSYLLDKIEIRHDTKNSTSYLSNFIRQKPGSNFLFLKNFRLGIYNLGEKDTAKWFNRTIMKAGSAPVIFSDRQTAVSMDQLKKQLNNQGYLNAKVDTILKMKGKKISVIYDLKAGIPYRIRNCSYMFSDTIMDGIISGDALSLLKKGDLFDLDLVEQERLRVSDIFSDAGYYGFSKEYLYFRADTMLNSREVDLYMDVYPAKNGLPHRRYMVDSVTVIFGLNPFDSKVDTTEIKDMKIIRGQDHFLRNSTIIRNNHIKSGTYFSLHATENTYDAYNRINAVKQTNIDFIPTRKDSTGLNAVIIVQPADAHKVKVGLTGRNSGGDLGISPDLTYQHRNLFNGGEQFGIKLKGAYEFIIGSRYSDLSSRSYFEYGIESDLSLPVFLFPGLKKSLREYPSSSTRFSVGMKNQHRQEYIRQFFNLGITYGWSACKDRLLNKLDLIDITYVRMPWSSEKFDSIYLSSENSMIRASYRDELISRTGYSFTLISSLRSFGPIYTIRGAIEVGGLLPHLVTTLSRPGDDREEKMIAGVPYAEYIKGSTEYAMTYPLSKKHSLAYHVMLGLAFPYGNSPILPFVKRFSAGGANSVRGWNFSTLGPGSYVSSVFEGDMVDLLEHTGNMKLELNIENRMKINNMFEFAQFVDAGNVWSLQSYEGEASRFRFNKFYKEIAVAYGIGLRFDPGFFLLRLDLGVRAYDPEEDPSKRFVFFHPRLNRMAWHFGIGYPF